MGWFTVVKAFLAGYKTWFIIAGVAAVLAALWLYVTHAERAKERLAVVEYQLGQAQDAARANSQAVADCEAVNKTNAAAAARVLERARQAELRLAAAGARADSDVETINREETTFRAAGRECPAIDSDFRRWLRGNT